MFDKTCTIDFGLDNTLIFTVMCETHLLVVEQDVKRQKLYVACSLHCSLSFCSATTMKFDQVNTLVFASLWPIIDCLLALSPKVKQKSKLLKNLQKSQVSRPHLTISYPQSITSLAP